MRDVSLGQYYPVKSIVHAMDARAKLVAVVLYIVTLFLIPTLSSIISSGGTLYEFLFFAGISYAAVVFVLVFAIILAKIPILKVLKSIKTILFLLLFMIVFSIFFYGGEINDGTWQWSWRFLSVSVHSLLNGTVMSLRLLLLVLGPTILTFTTTPTELTDGFESLMFPLKLIKFPVRLLALIMSLALSLIPGLIDETTKIINAQKSRCADFDTKNVFKKVKAFVPVLIPVFVQSLKRAEDLADAMDSRCFNSAGKRTRMRRLIFGAKDIGLCLFVLLMVFVIVTRTSGLYLPNIYIGLIVFGGVVVVLGLIAVIERAVYRGIDKRNDAAEAGAVG